MKKRSLKGLKPHITKQLALLMAICYLLHPLHQQFKTVIHEIAHAIETPNNVLNHGIAASYKSIHQEHEHQMAVVDHEHLFIDIWDSFFEKSSSEPPSEPFVDTTKIDKHLTSDAYWVDQIIGALKKHVYSNTNKKLCEGHFKKKPDPPKYFFNKC